MLALDYHTYDMLTDTVFNSAGIDPFIYCSSFRQFVGCHLKTKLELYDAACALQGNTRRLMIGDICLRPRSLGDRPQTTSG